MKYLNFVFCLFAVSVYAQNYQYSLDQRPTLLEENENPTENGKDIVIPQDFDWTSIPADYDNSVWIIKYDFDLENRNISLPDNVTLSFEGGILRNANLAGNETLITSNVPYQVFDGIDLDGSFKNEFLKPCWFGAVMDGVTDDRAYFIETLAQAESIDVKVLIDKDIFLDVEETGKKSIFLDDDAWIEGADNAKIIVNNLLSPAFIMAITKNITIKNLTILYDQAYDARFGFDSNSNNKNQQQIEDYLTDTKNIVYNSTNPVSRSPVSFRALFLLDAPENILFENVKLVSKGKTADKFIQMAIKLKEQNTDNQIINSGQSGNTDIPRNVKLINVEIDGALMGIQGIVKDFESSGLRSYRYSDAQTAEGTNIGGNVEGSYWMPPPHLIYLNSDSSNTYNCENIQIFNTIDHGDYVGSVNVRGSSGYCHSLKLVDDQINVHVKNYKAYRRDGFGDIGSITNGVFENIYTEGNSSIFDKGDRFTSFRFLGTLNHVTFQNITIKDISELATFYPLDWTFGNNVSMDNVNVYVNELNATDHGPFGISGSNNRVVNSSLKIKNHTLTEEYRGVVFLVDEAMANGSDNYYDIKVEGWRDISKRTVERSTRILLHESSNPNNNYAKVTDVSNKYVIEQTNEIVKRTWLNE